MANPVTVIRQPLEATHVVINYGEEWEQKMSLSCQWFALITSVMLIIWYTKQTYQKKCGWEEFYVCIVETIKVVFDMNVAFQSPATLYQYTGVLTHWLRYCEWLLTCPVILIHLSNLTGLDGEYSKRSMTLLVSDVGTIVMGISSALSRQGYLKVIFFMLGMTYGANTFFSASQAFMEGYNKVPKGRCKKLVKAMAMCFFGSWVWYPILFTLGPEGFGHLSIAGSDIAHTFVDMLSKNAFGIIGHFLRLEIRKHILKHGELKRRDRKAGGLLGSGMFDDLEDVETPGMLSSKAKSKTKFSYPKAPVSDPACREPRDTDMDAGVVIMGVKDASLIRYFQELFMSLNAKLTLMPAIGSESVKQTAHTLNPGSVDYVLLDAELVADASLLAFLKNQLGMRVCSFGWSIDSPYKELLENAPLDGVLEGPAFGKGVNLIDLSNLTMEMQSLKRKALPALHPHPQATYYPQGGYLQPGGHPGHYGYSQHQIQAEADTVHQLLSDINTLKQELQQ